jgi:NodT family efflux transporter outer membrane factor (OMF) lipoprotein
LRVDSEVIAIKPSQSKPDRGMVTLRSTTRNQAGTPVQVLTSKLVVWRREPAPLPQPVRKGFLAATAAMVLALSACAAGTDYQKPDIALAAFHSEAPKTGIDASLDHWWAGFQDPVLTGLIDRALQQNLDLAASLARVAQAQSAADQAGAKLLPQGALSSQAAPIHQSLHSGISEVSKGAPGFRRDLVQYDLGAGASWEIDLSGGLHRDAEAAAALAQAAESEHAGTRVTIAAEVADAYLQIRGYQARIAVAERQIADDDRLLALVALRKTHGVATDREESQADALAAQARASLPPLRIGLAAQGFRLDILLGNQPGSILGELSEPRAIPAQTHVELGASQDLLQRRPDIIAAERALAASHARIGSAISNYYPKVSLSALLGFEAIDAQRVLTAQAFQPQAAAGLRWRLFDFGRVDAEVAAARGSENEALARYRLSVLHAAEDVENAVTGMVELSAQAGALDRETKSLQHARDSAEEAYRGGAVSLLDVIDSDRQLLLAEDDLARVRTDGARSAVHTFRALGGGW